MEDEGEGVTSSRRSPPPGGSPVVLSMEGIRSGGNGVLTAIRSQRSAGTTCYLLLVLDPSTSRDLLDNFRRTNP